jgi:hypothetical protein
MLLAIDTETTGVDWHDEAFMISVATREWVAMSYDKRLCEHGKDWDEACRNRIRNAYRL